MLPRTIHFDNGIRKIISQIVESPVSLLNRIKTANKIAMLLTASLLLLGGMTNDAAAYRVCKFVKVSVKHSDRKSARNLTWLELRIKIKRHRSARYQRVGLAQAPKCILKRDGKYHCDGGQRMCKNT